MGTPMEVADPYGLLSPERRHDPYPLYAPAVASRRPCTSASRGKVLGGDALRDVNAGLRDLRLSSVRTGLFSQGVPEEVVRKLAPMGRNLRLLAALP